MAMKRVGSVLVFLALLLSCAGVSADEGMWPLYDLKKVDFKTLQARGLKLGADDIYNTKDGGLARAVFNIGGGTGSFISPDGLIITNHHVAFEAIQQQSTVETNFIRDGFYAPARQDEIPAVGYTLYVSLSTEDVTDRVLSALTDGMSDLERYKAIDQARKEIIKEAEADRDVRCSIATMFGGRQYILCTDFMIRDIRIVYVPPASIGQYGGDIDNWMWPRHTGDFSFLRAYVAPDGSSAEYSEKNVPYRPQKYLPLAKAGVRDGDFAMVIGFPGSTDRYTSSFAVDYLVNYRYPVIIEIVQDILGILDREGASDSSVAIRVASKKEGLNNFLKNSQGMLEGFEKGDLLGEKRETEGELTAFLKSRPALDAKYGAALPDLETLYRGVMITEKKDFMLRLMPLGSDLLSLSSTIYKWAAEREKDDMQRERGYQDRDSTRTRQGLEDAQINLVPSVDRATLEYFIRKALDLPEGQKIEALEKIFAGKTGAARDVYIQTYLDDLYRRTRVGELGARMAMFRMSQAELDALGDPFIDLAAALKPENDERIERSKKFRGGLSRLEPLLIGAYAEWKGGNLYPDANGTKRFNYGNVKGYRPRDAVWYDYLTTLTGVMEKETGRDPFVVPPELKQAWKNKDFGPYRDATAGDVPVDFLTTNDSTGGNSGSPLLNGKGEVIGLLFDGNYEAMTSDYLFDEALTRAINVDIRYVLFVVDRVYGLKELMREMVIH